MRIGMSATSFRASNNCSGLYHRQRNRQPGQALAPDGSDEQSWCGGGTPRPPRRTRKLWRNEAQMLDDRHGWGYHRPLTWGRRQENVGEGIG